MFPVATAGSRQGSSPQFRVVIWILASDTLFCDDLYFPSYDCNKRVYCENRLTEQLKHERCDNDQQ